MSKTIVVLLGYKSRSGKDTLYDLSGKEKGFTRAAFADKLKQTAADLYNLSDRQIFGDLKDSEDTRYPNLRDKDYIINSIGEIEDNIDFKPHLSARRILQFFGQDQRSLKPTIWADYVFNNTIPNLIKEGKNKFIITDFRFKNEYAVALKWQSLREDNILKVVNIIRPGILAQSGVNDVSENELNNFRFWTDTILNTGSIEEFREASSNLLTRYLEEL